MQGELVAIDLETTGLDSAKDFIIEVGAVRMRDGVIVDELSILVKPPVSIPPYVTHLTGITQDDVADAPLIEDILPKLVEFVGDSPIIAHNNELERGFLQTRYGIFKNNVYLDTYEIAAVLLPRSVRYNLNSLTQDMAIVLDNAHRALDDARATALLYWIFWHKLLALPNAIIAEICDLSRDLDWDTAPVFNAVFDAKKLAGVPYTPHELFFALPDAPAPIEGLQTQNGAVSTQIEGFIGQNGSFENTLPNFEHRPQQVDIATAIARAFEMGDHLIVEAGTGVGKSIGYLMPAILWAKSQNKRVVISTNTINLQDQLIGKDIPLLQEGLETPFIATVIKGKSNYLCPRRVETIRRFRPQNATELRLLAKILIWTLESQSGDKSEITLRGNVEHEVWNRFTAQDENCGYDRCEAEMKGICPFYRARKTAEEAQLVIVNHVLLLSDALSNNRVLPEYDYLVIDEAHQLEDAVTNSLTIRIDANTLIRYLSDLGTPQKGLFKEIISTLKDNLAPNDLQSVTTYIESVSEALVVMRGHVSSVFKALGAIADESQDERYSDSYINLRIEPTQRKTRAFHLGHNRWETLTEFFDVITTALTRLKKAVSKFNQQRHLGHLEKHLESTAQYLQNTYQQLRQFFIQGDENLIYWLSGESVSEYLTLNIAPLRVGRLIEQHIWGQKKSVILTSATLNAHDDFHYIKDRLYAHNIKALDVGSPFDYRQSTLVYVPNDIPEINDKQGYQKGVEKAITDVSLALGGKVLVLFTSYAHLKQTAQALYPILEQNGIHLYDQSDGSSRNSLLEGFRTAEHAVLFGTKSFWEGIDIAGDQLSALIMPRLPFAVPSDPIFMARSELYTESFLEYALPDAILRFRQGFGRLIRSNTDRGVVVLLDARILNKRYGATFLESLPDCTMRDGALESLPSAAVSWLNK
jgi:DNA polymerase-3 subunit epsilon/ATP-dependent DNA helicase DinG